MTQDLRRDATGRPLQRLAVIGARSGLQTLRGADAVIGREVGAQRDSVMDGVEGLAEAGSGSGEKAPQVAASDPAKAARAPPRTDRAPRGEQRGDAAELIPGPAGALEHEKDRTRTDAGHGDPERKERHGIQRASGQGDLTAVETVTASGCVGGLAGATLTVGRGRSLADPGLGDHDDPMAGQVRPPGQVQVVPELPEGRVETAEGGEDIAPDEHSGGVDAQDVGAVVVLSLVGLAARGASRADPRAGDLLPDLEQAGGVVPGGELRAGDADRR